ncbi:metallophosphoesterase [Pseudomonas sp. GW6]
MSLVKRFHRNAAGRDFAVGDIHGHFSLLERALSTIRFDSAVDRLFSVGDLVDRGPESHEALAWLDKPWFHAVRGNHDDYVCRFETCDMDNWSRNGGAWFTDLSASERLEFSKRFKALPLAIEVTTTAGLVGIVHADCPCATWSEFIAELEAPSSSARLRSISSSAMWSRSRLKSGETASVDGVVAIVCGHSPVECSTVIGNVHHIDTGAWREGGRFTLLDLEHLSPAS